MENFLNSFESNSFVKMREDIKLWEDLEIIQLDHGEEYYDTQQLLFDGVFLSHTFFQRRKENRGATPKKDMWLFHFTNDTNSNFFINGRFIKDNEITVHQPYSEFMTVTPNNHSSYTLGIKEEILEKIFELRGITNIKRKLQNKNSILIEEHSMKFIRSLLQNFFLEIKEENFTLQESSQNKYLNIKIFELLSAIAYAITNSTKLSYHKKANRVVLDVQEFINNNRYEKLSIAKIAEHLHHSQRTINYNFSKYYGIPAKKYISCLKLSLIKSDLLQKKRESTKIIDIATKYGFWHMGQFSKDYKELFNELPLETLKRSL